MYSVFPPLELAKLLGILGFVISVINLVRAIIANRINVDASLSSFGSDHSLTIYNNSTRKITVTYIRLYTANRKNFSTKNIVRTRFDEGKSLNLTIAPYELANIDFSGENQLSGVVVGERIYVKVWVSGRPVKTICISPSRLSVLMNKISSWFKKDEPFI